jgi:hypothetical protein
VCLLVHFCFCFLILNYTFLSALVPPLLMSIPPLSHLCSVRVYIYFDFNRTLDRAFCNGICSRLHAFELLPFPTLSAFLSYHILVSIFISSFGLQCPHPCFRFCSPSVAAPLGFELVLSRIFSLTFDVHRLSYHFMAVRSAVFLMDIPLPFHPSHAFPFHFVTTVPNLSHQNL